MKDHARLVYVNQHFGLWCSLSIRKLYLKKFEKQSFKSNHLLKKKNNIYSDAFWYTYYIHRHMAYHVAPTLKLPISESDNSYLNLLNMAMARNWFAIQQ